jgi:propionyl-CoA carboxylase alpha chain
MPVTSAADTGKKLLCPMPGLVVSIAVSEGQEVKSGETLGRGRGHEDAERAARRARRHGEEDPRRAGATLAVDALILEFA